MINTEGAAEGVAVHKAGSRPSASLPSHRFTAGRSPLGAGGRSVLCSLPGRGTAGRRLCQLLCCCHSNGGLRWFCEKFYSFLVVLHSTKNWQMPEEACWRITSPPALIAHTYCAVLGCGVKPSLPSCCTAAVQAEGSQC